MRIEKLLVELMRGNGQYDKKTLSRLSKIIRKYPYFQSAQLLYTLCFFHLKDARFVGEIRKTATCLNDRTQLFFLVEKRFFDLDKIKSLQHNIPKNADSDFNLIDSFLDKKGNMPEKTHISPVVSTDYAERYLLDYAEEETEKYKPLQFQDVIDRFLEKDENHLIKIEPVDRNAEPTEKEKPEAEPIPDSEQTGGGVFSETLAKIYIKQREYEKALEIIRKIVLHYPEKSSYFADRIQMLEDLTGIHQ